MKIYKILFILFVLSFALFLVFTNYTINNYSDNEKTQMCMYGCVAGIHHNNTHFVFINITNPKTLINVEVCETFCNLMVSYENKGEFTEIK